MEQAASIKFTSTLSHPLFKEHESVWRDTINKAHIKVYSRNETVLHHGDKASALWLVLEGWVKITRQTPDGKENIVGLCTDGYVFGEASLFPNANYPYNAEVIGERAVLAAIPAETIRKLIDENSSVSASIMSLLYNRTSETRLKLEQMSTMSASQRLGCFLLRLCHSQAGDSRVLQIPVEKHLLATYLGMKPETLSRSQQQLKSLGISVSGNTITISSIEKLREFVCNSCSESGNCETEDT